MSALPRSRLEEPFEPDAYSSTAPGEILDRTLHAITARFTAGLSPLTLICAYLDWAAHMSFSPGKRLELVEKAARKASLLASYVIRRTLQERVEPCIEPLPQDHRFDDPAWQQVPFVRVYQSFLLTQQWWHGATTGMRGVRRQDRAGVDHEVLHPRSQSAQLARALSGRARLHGVHDLLEESGS